MAKNQDMPAEMLAEYARESPTPPADRDERFDEAFDFVTSHDDAPMEPDEPEEIDVELAREWTYQLLDETGHSYHPKRKKAKGEDNPRENPAHELDLRQKRTLRKLNRL